MQITINGNFPLALAAIVGLLVTSSGAVLAQGSEPRERASVVFGAFITDRESSTRLDPGDGDGTEIDLEDDLGLEGSTSVARLGGYFWLNEKHRLDFSYFDLDRNASKQIQETINFGDATFVINTLIESESKLSIIKADYTYAILARDRGYLGLTGGLYVATTSLELREAQFGGRAESSDVTAPLPVIGLRGDYEIGEKFTLRGALQIFRFAADDVEGRFSDFYVGADYGITDRFALGLAYNRVAMNLEAVEDQGRSGRVNWGYDGLLLYMKYDFGGR